MQTMYFVSSYNFVKENEGWNYKVEGRYDTLDLARKAYHALLGNYIGNTAYGSVAVILTDSYGNIKEHEYWVAPVEPEPEEE